jgi:molybdenum cofactor guanylyltransferase
MIPIVILAGGKGARMGGNKPMQPYGGTTLIEATLARLRPQASDIVINAGTRRSAIALSLETLGLPLIFDDDACAGLGPLSGVLTALNHAAEGGFDAVITVPCDMPHLPVDMIGQLGQNRPADIVHFTGKDDYPLCALWHVSLRPGLITALSAAQNGKGVSVRRYQSTQSVHRLRTDDDHAFGNVNSPLKP